jgi:hypothetical protein
MTATVTAPPAAAPATAELPDHRPWCNMRHCKGTSEHFSEQYLLNGAMPLIVEVFQGSGDEAPSLSIVEYHGEMRLTIPVAEVWPLAVVLAHIAEGVLTGSKLDPRGCGRIDLDNPPDC